MFLLKREISATYHGVVAYADTLSFNNGFLVPIVLTITALFSILSYLSFSVNFTTIISELYATIHQYGTVILVGFLTRHGDKVSVIKQVIVPKFQQ